MKIYFQGKNNNIGIQDNNLDQHKKITHKFMRQPSRNIEGFVLKQTSNISGVNSLPATLKDVSYDGHILNNILKMNMK